MECFDSSVGHVSRDTTSVLYICIKLRGLGCLEEDHKLVWFFSKFGGEPFLRKKSKEPKVEASITDYRKKKKFAFV